ncbi:MAG: RNA polymerase sigma factor [Kiloniellales bacterium]
MNVLTHDRPDRLQRSAVPVASWSEAELIAAARDGDGAAFEVIMRSNNRLLFRTARSILKDDSEAEDVVQETYVRAYAHLGRFAQSSRLSTWLVRIAVNESLGRLRRRMPARGLDGPLDDLAESRMTDDQVLPLGLAARPAYADPESRAARDEIRRLLEQAIDALPQAQRAVFVLRAVEEFSVAETALCLGIPQETVKTRFHRARRALRRLLSDEVATALLDTFPFAGARCDRIVAGALRRSGLTSSGLPERPSG